MFHTILYFYSMLVWDSSCAMLGKSVQCGAVLAATGYYQKINWSKIKIAIKWFYSDDIDWDFFMWNVVQLVVWNLMDRIAKGFTYPYNVAPKINIFWSFLR